MICSSAFFVLDTGCVRVRLGALKQLRGLINE
jgi:hypothetical protein